MERAFIEWLQNRLTAQSGSSLLGNDAAVLSWPPGHDCVVTTDLIADGTHFRVEECGFALAGPKALAVNLSDLAAMAAEPVAAFVSLLLPRSVAATAAREILEGMESLALDFKIEIAGGDTNVWPGPLVINVAALGRTAPGRAWRRDRMLVGDCVCLTGPLGDSLTGGPRAHHLQFVPRIHEARFLAKHFQVHAALDISDGLALDLSRMAAASHCGIEVAVGDIPLRGLAQGDSPERRESLLREALFGGEDFELAVALSPAEFARYSTARPPDAILIQVGQAIEGRGIWQRSDSGPSTPLEIRGYEHGGSP